MKAVIYCRVSSKEQVEGTSLESQKLACEEYAQRNGFSVSCVFVERGESAKYADRTQLLEMMTYCENPENGIDVLLVWKVDRLARNVSDHFAIKAVLVKHGVRVVSVTEPIDARPEGKLLETILAGFAQFDNDVRASRTLLGMRRKIQEGIFPWKAPLGYKSRTQSGKKKTEPDVPNQPAFGILREGWLRFATGTYTKADIRRFLTDLGLRSQSGKPLSSQTIDNIFIDAFYAGIIRDPWSGENYTGRHIAMVTRETFEVVQRIIKLRNRSVPHRLTRPEFPLRSFVRCPNCEHSLTGSFSRGRSKYYPYYHCHNRTCDKPGNYALDAVHREFSEFLERSSINPHLFGHLKEYMLQICASWTSLERALKERRRVEAKQLESQLEQLVRMKMEQMITDEEYRAHREASIARLAELEKVPAMVQPDRDSVLDDLDVICKPVSRLANTWRNLPITFQQRFQHIMLPTGFVHGTVGTARKAHILTLSESSLPADPTVVAQCVDSWNFIMNEMAEWGAIQKAIVI